MSDDWQIGDLALCVNATRIDGYGHFGPRLKHGAVYLVVGIGAPGVWADGSFSVGLIIEGPQNSNRDGDWHPRRFRKIRPLTYEERDSFIADLREPTLTPAVRLREMKASYHREENDRGQ